MFVELFFVCRIAGHVKPESLTSDFVCSLESAFREDQDKVGLPRIPVQPIGYDEAEELLK
jgi:hypothetical protein